LMDGFPVLDFNIHGFSSLQSYRFYNPPTLFEAKWYYLKATLNNTNILAHNHLRPGLCCAHQSLLYTHFLFIEKVGMNKIFQVPHTSSQLCSPISLVYKFFVQVPHTSLECGWYGSKLYTCLQLINIQVINTLQAQEAPYTF
jgi:hypothetical protein